MLPAADGDHVFRAQQLTPEVIGDGHGTRVVVVDQFTISIRLGRTK